MSALWWPIPPQPLYPSSRGRPLAPHLAAQGPHLAKAHPHRVTQPLAEHGDPLSDRRHRVVSIRSGRGQGAAGSASQAPACVVRRLGGQRLRSQVAGTPLE